MSSNFSWLQSIPKLHTHKHSKRKGQKYIYFHHLLPWEISTITSNLLSLWMPDFPKTVTPVSPTACALLAMYLDMLPLSKWWHLFPWTWADIHCLDQQESDTTWLLRLGHKNAMQFYLILLEHSCHALRKFKPRHMDRPHVGRCSGWHPSWRPSQQLASTPDMGVMLSPDDCRSSC